MVPCLLQRVGRPELRRAPLLPAPASHPQRASLCCKTAAKEARQACSPRSLAVTLRREVQVGHTLEHFSSFLEQRNNKLSQNVRSARPSSDRSPGYGLSLAYGPCYSEMQQTFPFRDVGPKPDIALRINPCTK